MLADQAELPLVQVDPAAAERLALEAYARHLLRVHGGQQARLTRVRHFMLSPREKMEGTKLDAPHKYETAGQAVQRASDLDRPTPQTAGRNTEFGATNPHGPWRSFR